ncbi:MAG TPA: SRPBCC domain-containing protein [bacterium]|nr:SRPBCC domain-containing protein [bacterium]
MAARTPLTVPAPSAAREAARREVVITRVFDAPRSLVFQAWTDPRRLARWWGPQGFTNPVCEVDARVGGAWRIVMRGPDGTDYPCGGVYREVVVPERLVFTNIATDAEGNPVLDGLTTVLFGEQGRQTRLTLQSSAVAVVDYAAAYLAGMEEGWTQSLVRLSALLAGQPVV